MINLEGILKGNYIDEGKDRKIFELDGRIYKIAFKGSERSNLREYDSYNFMKDRYTFLNPSLNLSDDYKIMEAERCIPIYELIAELKGMEVTKNKLRSIRMQLTIKDEIFDIIKKYDLERFITFTKEDIKNFCKKENKDEDEIMFPLNWGFNRRLNQLVLLDYAE